MKTKLFVVFALASLVVMALLCAESARPSGVPAAQLQGLPTNLCLGVYHGKLWLVAQSPILSYMPDVLLQPSTRCIELPPNSVVNPAGSWTFPP